jgi:hypothetical protein
VSPGFAGSLVLILVVVSPGLVPLHAQPRQRTFEQYVFRDRPAPAPITRSPSGRIVVEHRFRDPDSPRQIWLRDAGSALEPAFLYEYPRTADVLFSPDERWVVVNDFAGSNVADVRIFQRSSGLNFREEKGADPSRSCWASMSRTFAPGLVSSYAEAIRWASDSRALLVVLWGHADGESFVDDWLCVYDLRARRASQDLRLMNRGAVRSRRPAR